MNKIAFVFLISTLSCARVSEIEKINSQKLEDSEKLLKDFFSIDIYTIPTDEKKSILQSTSSLQLHLLKRQIEDDNLSWQEADKLYKDYLAKNVTNSYEKTIRYQQVANYMLRNSSILEQPKSLEKCETLNFYLNLLVEAKSSDAELIHTILEQLNGFLSKEQQKNIAKYVVLRQEEVAKEKALYLSQKQKEQVYKLEPNNKKQEALVNDMITKTDSRKSEALIRKEKALKKLDILIQK
jgi:hypothetical protein